jgi:hypothetical protein
MKFVLTLLIFSLLILPVVLSDIVEITIEYETTTTIPGATTTTPTGDGGSGGGDGGAGITTTTIETIAEDIMLTYSMPEYLKIYQNETGVFNIKVNNEGTLPLNNVFITISGIPSDSYSISPSTISTLEPGKSSSFSVSINPEKLTIGTHTLTIKITSDEKYETAALSLDLKAYTRDVAEEIEEREEVEEEIEKRRLAWSTLLITMIIVLVFLLVFDVVLTIIKRSSKYTSRMGNEPSIQ